MNLPGFTADVYIPLPMLEKAAARLSWIALVCAGTAIVIVVMQNMLQPEVAQLQKAVPHSDKHSHCHLLVVRHLRCQTLRVGIGSNHSPPGFSFRGGRWVCARHIRVFAALGTAATR